MNPLKSLSSPVRWPSARSSFDGTDCVWDPAVILALRRHNLPRSDGAPPKQAQACDGGKPGSAGGGLSEGDS